MYLLAAMWAFVFYSNSSDLLNEFKGVSCDFRGAYAAIFGFLFKAGAGCQDPRVLLQAPSNDREKKKQDKEKKKRRGPPTGQSGYQIFLKHECARLKAHDPDIDGKKVLRMAVDAWQKMSATDKEV